MLRAGTLIMYFKVSASKCCLGVPVHGRGHFPCHLQHCLQSIHSSQRMSCSSSGSQQFRSTSLTNMKRAWSSHWGQAQSKQLLCPVSCLPTRLGRSTCLHWGGKAGSSHHGGQQPGRRVTNPKASPRVCQQAVG